MDERQIALVENGRVIELKHGELKLRERIPGGYVFVDGTGVGDVIARPCATANCSARMVLF